MAARAQSRAARESARDGSRVPVPTGRLPHSTTRAIPGVLSPELAEYRRQTEVLLRGCNFASLYWARVADGGLSISAQHGLPLPSMHTHSRCPHTHTCRSSADEVESVVSVDDCVDGIDCEEMGEAAEPTEVATEGETCG